MREVPPGAVAAHAQLIQQGFEELWVVEDLPYSGGISQMLAVLEATENVVVGHGIAPAPFRNPAALAMEWATLAELHPHRIAGGIGHGVPEWMAQIGQSVESPLTLLRETIEAVRLLLAGELVTADGRYVQLKEVALHFPPLQIPRVSAGVTGPKSLKLSGAVADGTILPSGKSPQDVQQARALINEGRAEAGRTDEHRLTVFTGFFCGDESTLPAPPPYAPSESWAAIGPNPEAVAEMLQALVAAGADSIVLVPYGTDSTEQLQLAATEIAPRLDR